jgi:Zn-dependent protease with chaperone function
LQKQLKAVHWQKALPSSLKSAQYQMSEKKSVMLVTLSMIFPFFGLYLLILMSARVSRSSRRMLVRLFSPSIRLVMIILSVLILFDAAIVVYGAYELETTLLHRLHAVLIGSIGLVALLGALTMIRFSFTFTKRLVADQLGAPVTRNDQPRLWETVDQIATKLKARPPNNIILGLQPNFYATAANVRVLGTDATMVGETLYLSLPLLRILSKTEMAAVIGHELGHFMGEDTAYTLRFVPIYQGLAHGLASLSSSTSNGASGLALLPATVILGFCFEQFASAERTIGRQREIAADKIGASLNGSEPLITALIKTSAFTPIWYHMEKTTIEWLNSGQVANNLSDIFATHVVAVKENLEPKDLLAGIAETRQSHPTDTHPTLRERADALGTSLADAEKWVMSAGDSAIELVSEYDQLERDLTISQQRVYLALGLAQMPPQEEGEAAASGTNPASA